MLVIMVYHHSDVSTSTEEGQDPIVAEKNFTPPASHARCCEVPEAVLIGQQTCKVTSSEGCLNFVE